MIEIKIDKTLAYWMLVAWVIIKLPDFILGVVFLVLDWPELMEWLS